MSLQLSEKFSLPKEAALWTFGDLAIKGAGKTYDAAKMAEQMIKLGIPIVVLDPMGIWWGLRVGAKPGVEGLPVVIFGGAHQDLAIPTSARGKFEIVDEDKLRKTVNAILQEGLSVVLDTSQLSKTQQTRTVGIFADELFRKNAPYGVRHVFIEEADVFCPQKSSGEVAFSQGAIDNLVRRGGNFNLGCTMITQRAAVLNKDVLSQATCLIVLRIMFIRDKQAVQDWVKSAVKDERELRKLAKWYDSLRKLKNGEAWIYSPEHEIFEKVQFGLRETLHASREYFLQETWEQKNITLRDVTSFVKAYKAKIEPKPTVKAIQPSVASALSSKDSGYAAIEHETRKEATVGQAVDKTIGGPTVQWTETVGKTPSQIHNPQPALDKMEMRIPDNQQAQMQVHLSGSGSSEGVSRAQYEPALAETSTAAPEAVSNTLSQQSERVTVLLSRPNLIVPVGRPRLIMDEEPKTLLGKICVVLKRRNRKDMIFKKTILEGLAKHGWAREDPSEVIAQLLRIEILTDKGTNGYYADLDRIEILEHEGVVQVS